MAGNQLGVLGAVHVPIIHHSVTSATTNLEAAT
jgi:hypothetical protein